MIHFISAQVADLICESTGLKIDTEASRIGCFEVTVDLQRLFTVSSRVMCYVNPADSELTETARRLLGQTGLTGCLAGECNEAGRESTSI